MQTQKGVWHTSIVQFSPWVAVHISLSKELHDAVNLLSLTGKMKACKKYSVFVCVRVSVWLRVAIQLIRTTPTKHLMSSS